MIIQKLAKNFLNTPEFSQLNASDKVNIEGISSASYPLLISSLFLREKKQILVVLDSTQKMNDLLLDLSCFLDDNQIIPIPSWETLPYEFVSPPEKVERQRITALYSLLDKKQGVYITTVEGLIRTLPSPDFLLKRGLKLTIDEEIPYDDIIETLVEYGYTRENRVETFGQFSVKGGIIDVYLSSYSDPVRLDFFDDTLESIRLFDINSQVSIGKTDEVTIYPRKELILFNNEKKELIDILTKAQSQGKELTDEILMSLENQTIDDIHGIEDLFPFIIEEDSLLSYIQEDALIIHVEPAELLTKKRNLNRTFDELYSSKKSSTLCCDPQKLLHPHLYDQSTEKAIVLQTMTTSPDALRWPLRSLQNFHGKIKAVREEIGQRLDDGWKVIITTGFEGQARRLHDLLKEFNPDSHFNELKNVNLSILITPLHEGVEIIPTKTLLLSDHEIFGKSYRKKKQFKKKASRPIDSFLDLKIGDYVVHLNHGIGTFTKIERMSAGGVERDFLHIEYADGDKLYVPLDQITMVQKYIGAEGRKPRIDSLGKKSAWNRIKKKALEAVEEIAKELLEIYSKRNALKGYQYPPDTLWQEEFESLFEYEETPDQITTIEDVKDDMENIKPMDRLVCGDVGFGKTEVAIRAAFKSVMAGRQVAILVPTTVLAMQHYNNFKKRFAEYPIDVEMMSRFKSRKEIIEIKEKLSKGKVDIVIGTHALIAKDVKIENLGLLIIDEEQRFGVRHKEQLKKLRSTVDVMTLSATPIPRTLHMSMAGMRDLSIISTPPENRQSIETYVMEDNPDILRRAILTELERDGQAFFVHNRVQTIDAMATMLENLVPEASIGVAHGQMGENELEEVIIDFLDKKYDILISTTIIESGLDIPNVNTIIINRADTFGLSQLYQLKGRVGRSERRAYAYLFYPRHVPLSEDAQKRLNVIAEYSELGSGFKIAMKDLEIRGAGNILGKEQSGSIMDVGFDLYCQMLEDTVRSLKGEEPLTPYRTPVFVRNDLFIPNSYISDEMQKIEFYKRFESCNDVEEIDTLTDEMIDRFGNPPSEVLILIEMEKIRTIASSLRIEEILEDSKAFRLTITGESRINPEKLIPLIHSDDRLAVDPKMNEVLLFSPHEGAVEKKLLELKKWLQQLT